ncbi:TraR/DksA family transcriptional regulator [Citrobacter portucalensis]|uniref:TraR/DksA family transcriptional regulator n=1 Tax=Citrobacter portucalensis TaxID=1639133 RepID=UPI003B269505
MTEIIDQASALEEMMRENAIRAHRLNHSAVSATHCEECDEQIPEPRRAAVPGCQTCAECESVIELRNKQRGL